LFILRLSLKFIVHTPRCSHWPAVHWRSA